MKIPKKWVYSSILIIVLLFFFISFFSYYKFPGRKGIFIEAENDFKRYMCPGKGTEEDPFRIENKRIINSGGIYVHVNTKHYVIQNCYIEGATTGLDLDGGIENSVKINNCTIRKCGTAFRIDFHAKGVSFENNTIESNNFAGYFKNFYYVTERKKCTFINNRIMNNEYGISLDQCENTVLEDNIFINNTYRGLHLTDNHLLFIYNNNFTNDGMTFYSSLWAFGPDHSFGSIDHHGNLINGKPFGYFERKTNLTIEEEYGQLLLYKCKNITIRNQRFLPTHNAIYAHRCTNVTLENSSFIKNYIGVALEYCYNVAIKEITMDEGEKGIELFSGSNFVIQDSIFTNYNISIFSDSLECEILNCSFQGGIGSCALGYLEDFLISYCSFVVPNQYAIYLHSCTGGTIEHSSFILREGTDYIAFYKFAGINLINNSVIWI